MARKRPATNAPALDKAKVLEVLAQNPNATKRDISRALGVKGSDRILLKRILRELDAEGLVRGSRKKGYVREDEIPDVTVLEIIGQDNDGELLARPQSWTSDKPPPRIVVVPGRDDAGSALGIGERILARLTKLEGEYEARSIKRLGASAHKVLGVVRISPRGARIVPIDRKSRSEFSVDTRDLLQAKQNELVLVEPLSGRDSGFPRAKVIEKLGSMDAPRTVSLIAIHSHGIPTDFPPEVLNDVKQMESFALKGRTDLRAVPLLTIDPEDARDHDDAVWAEADTDPANPGGHVAIVAIADVAHYVVPGSPLDREAYKRGNSVYFPDRVVPMLPERLSADLCSLKEKQDRPCLAVRMVFDSRGHKKSHAFMRATMRSAARLTYAQAQKAFDGNADAALPPNVKEALAALWKTYSALAEARKQRDPLDLDLPERRIVIGEDGKVQSIAFRERLESMRLIEEFMVLANVCAAETLEKARQPLIYRVHDHPSKEKLFSFSDFLRTIGQSFAKGQVIKPGTFNRILSQAKGSPHEKVMNDVVLRTQAQAVYDPNNVGHFGLNLAKYAHFTSPIRRYADLIVHRALIRGLKLGDGGLTDREDGRLGEIAEHISMTERRAMAAERDSTDRYVAAFMEDRIGAVFDARITGVTRFGLFVRLPETGAEGLLPARGLGAEYFRHDERAHALIGERSRTAYKLGDTIRVRLAEAAPLTGGLRFDLVDKGQPGRGKAGPSRPTGPKSRKQRRGKRPRH